MADTITVTINPATHKTDAEWREFCRPFVFMNGSHEMPNYPAICRAVLALAAAPSHSASDAVDPLAVVLCEILAESCDAESETSISAALYRRAHELIAARAAVQGEGER